MGVISDSPLLGGTFSAMVHAWESIFQLRSQFQGSLWILMERSTLFADLIFPSLLTHSVRCLVSLSGSKAELIWLLS